MPLGLLASAVVAPLALSYYLRPATYAYPLGDGAFIELYTLHATRGAWSLGPYSQFGWHHPGPLLFYLLAPLYSLAGTRTLALGASAGLINLSCLVSTLWVVRRWATPAVSGVVAITLCAFVWRVSGLTTSTWNPHIIVLPFGLFVTLCAGLASGRLWTLPLLAFVGSFLVQTHLSTAPCVVLLLGAALAMAITARSLLSAEAVSDSSRPLMRWLGASTVVLVILWALPLAEQVAERPGNLTKIVTFFMSPAPGQPWSLSARAWADTMLTLVRPALRLPVGRPLEIEEGVGSCALAIAQVVALAIAGRWAMRRGARFDAALCLLGALASIAGLWSITQIRTAIGDYMVFWMATVGTLNWAVLSGIGLSGILASARHRPWREACATGTVSAITITACVAQTAFQFQNTRNRALAPPVGDSRHVQVLSEALELDLRMHNKRRPMVVISSAVWGEAAGVVLQLYKHGVPVVVGEGLGPLYGAPLTPTGDEDSVFYIADADRSDELAGRPHDRAVIERGRVFVHADE